MFTRGIRDEDLRRGLKGIMGAVTEGPSSMDPAFWRGLLSVWRGKAGDRVEVYEIE
jgi:hypothetical protein